MKRLSSIEKTMHYWLSAFLKMIVTLFFLSGTTSLEIYARDTHAPGNDSQYLLKGIVTDKGGVPLPGVAVKVKDSNQGALTDIDGNYSLYVDASTVIVQFYYLGYTTKEIMASDANGKIISLEESGLMVEETVVVGYGKQKKLTFTGALSTIDAGEITKVATPSLSNSLAGQMPGVITRQSSGEPGYDAASIYIRGLATWGNVNPLILVDGIERDLNQINAQEVENLTILKDASATAVYGARGANGVILITTKRGKVGKPNITFRTETAMLTALRRPDYIGGYEYANLMNEALRYNHQADRWQPDELQKYKDGSDPYLYPNVDWSDLLLKKHTWQTINSLSVSGGTDIIKYYLNVGFTMQNGLWNEDPNNKFNTNTNIKRYNFRNNTDVKLAKSLTLQLGLGAIIQNGVYPGWSSSYIFKAMNVISPIEYPVYNPDGSLGGAQTYVGYNPWGRATQSGYQKLDSSTIQASIGLNWELDFITKGLSARALFAYDRYSSTYNQRAKEFEVKRYLGKNPETGEDLYSPVYREEKPLGYVQSTTSDRSQYFEAQINYDRSFKNHNVGAMVLFNQREYINLTAGDSRSNIPYRRIGFAGRVTYNYAGRYLIEGNFGYNGSENFARGHRFGFFPSGSIGWLLSEEPFFRNAKNVVNRFKIRVSHGLVGNDAIGMRFGYMSTINTDGQSYIFGETQKTFPGMEENAIGNEKLTWETARKTDIGFDIGLWRDILSLQIDAFYEYRSNLLLQRQIIPNVTGIYPWSVPYANLGIVKNRGIDALLESHINTDSGVMIHLRGNFTYAHNTIIENDEPKPKYPYLSSKGLSLGQRFGFVAEGFFESQEEIDSWPRQTFGVVRPGDVKYKDINGDGIIDTYDQIVIGYARTPEISYGFGGTIAYKGFDFSVFFNGAARTSIDVGGFGMWAFYDGIGTNNVLEEYYNNRWTEDNHNAKYPAIDVGNNPNNFVSSTIWVKNGNYLRLRNAELGYSLPKRIVEKIGMSQFRIFVNGMNLLTFDSLKFIDPESNDGIGQYPLQRSYNFGFQINFK